MSERCEFCEGPATWQFTEVVAGLRHTVHVCAPCAQLRGIVGVTPSAGSVADVATGPAPQGSISFEVAPSAPHLSPPTAPRRCTHCGTTLVAIRKSGRVGCPHCYTVFRPHLEPLLRRVHGALEHRGHRPAREVQAAAEDPRPGLETLREELRRAIEAEDFENAARLRDAIAQRRDPAPRERS